MAIFCLLFSLHFLNGDGHLYEYTEVKNNPILFNLFNLVLVNLAIIFEALFIQQYLSLKNRFPKWNKALHGIIFLDIIIIGLTTAYYLITLEFNFAITTAAFFQLVWLVFKPFFLIKIWRIKDMKIQIFAFAWALSLLFAITAWTTYFIPGANAAPILKLSIGIFTSIIVISLSYYAAKSRTDKLIFEKEKELLQIRTQELQQLDQLKSRFFANISHELRTPLTLILSPINSILKRDRLDHRDFTFAKLIQQNAHSLLKRANEILDLTKMESGKMDLKEEKVILYPILKRIIANFESLADSEGIQLHFQYQADEYLQIELDADKFEKIVQNLLVNAIKFTPNGGKIIVDFQDAASHFILKIIDNGRGINPKDLPYIFDPYFQSLIPNAPAEGGTGIGLALCKEFAQLMKGKLSVESTLKAGSTFIFKFPKKEILGQVQSTAIEAMGLKEAPDFTQPIDLQSDRVLNEKAAISNGEESAQPCILIVEDNFSLRQYLQTLLVPNYQTITAQNGRKAWEYLNSDNPKPALILSDIMMPEMDGYQLLEKLKTSDRFRHIPVIMLTAKAGLEDKLKALRIGVDDYMLKPFEEEELFARIENILANQSARKSLVGGHLKFQKTKAIKSQPGKPTAVLSPPLEMTAEDARWLEQLENKVTEELSNLQFGVQHLADALNISTRQLQRRIRQLTGLSPQQYIQEARLIHARNMLESRRFDSVKAVALEIGLQNVGYFGQLYKKRFGKLPSEYG